MSDSISKYLRALRQAGKSEFLAFSDLKEHKINGTRLTANITGTFNFDWNAYSQFVLTPTGATTLGNTNLPTGTNSKEIKGIIKAGSVVTLPANWVATADSDAFDNTLDNHFRAWVSAENVVTFTNKNKAVSFTNISENEFGTHPAFTNQHDLNAWLLGNSSSGGATTLNSPVLSGSNTKADENTLTWTDTNS